MTPSQDTPNAEILDADDMKEDSDFSWKVGEKEGESLNEVLERNCFPKAVDTVVDSPEKSFIVSAQDTVLNVYVNEMEEDSSFSKISERDDVYLNGRLAEESLFEDEETVVFSPKSSFVNASGPDTGILSSNDIQHQSNNIFWMVGKDEKRSNGNGNEESLLEGEETVVYSPKDRLEATILGANNIQNHSWKAGSEEDYLNESLEEKLFLKDEDIVVDNSQKSFEVNSGQYATVSGVDELEEQLHSSRIAGKNEERNFGGLERDPVLEDEERIVPRLKNPFKVSVHEIPDKTISGVNDIQNHLNISWTTDKDELESFTGRLEEESLLEDEDTVVYRPTELLVMSDQDLPDTPLLVDDKMGKHWEFPEKADEGKSLNGFVKEEAMLEVQEKVLENHEEALELARNDMNEDAFAVDDVEKHSMSWRDEREEKNLNVNTLEVESIAQETVDSSTESLIVPDLINTYAKNPDVDEMEKQPKWKIDKDGGTLIQSLEEKSMFEVEEGAVDSPKESIAISEYVNTNVVMSDVYELEKESTWTTDKEGESLNRILEAQKKGMDSSSGNEKNASDCQVPEVNGSIQSINSDSGYRGEDLVSHSMTQGGAMTPHASDVDALDISTDAVRVENTAVTVNRDHVDEDSNLGKSAAIEDCKSCEIPEMTNGNHLQESDRSPKTVAEIKMPVLAVKTGTSDLESNPQDIDSLEEVTTEPQIPESTLYPLVEGQTPLSGSQQDRLWEEQAEAYSSGGQGTPSRNDDAPPASAPFHPPSSPGEQPTSSDDQIQPASGPMNDGDTVAGPSNGAGENVSALHEPKGKAKLHTPLRSLLLEDAGKSSDGSPSTSNAVTSSPSFIRRLFRAMSTPSRAAERDVSQAKLKKSSSMWVSCLGSPQVKK